ncbi:unnamed protein product [Paramecium pentaurelia]|uniref:Protein kinase domain-containing protein n=1 Tax=Paramecium pentaurelia TaxID=43138 RepID=A0A8S1SBA8_9CILI|nr:unnamed protein product [Paramecium pentaurelia]
MSDFETLENDLGNKYCNFQEIGFGSFATVFHAECLTTKKNVAIKMISKQGLQVQILHYLNQEIEILKRCNHENIIKFYEKYETMNTVYIVLEECKKDLGVLFEEYFDCEMPEKYVIFIILQLIEGFKQLHQQFIIHRDIKLENIMVQMTDYQLEQLRQRQFDVLFSAKFKIADMGLSKQLASQTDLAQTYAGSPMTMAPEILENKSYGRQADIFSLGVIMFQMLFGRFPFKNEKDHISEIKKQTISFQDSQIQISNSMKTIIQSMLKYDPNQRIQLNELKQELTNLLKENKIIFEFDDDQDQDQENQSEQDIEEGTEKYEVEQQQENDEQFEILTIDKNDDDKIIEELYNQRKQYLLLAKAHQQIYEQDIVDQFYNYDQYQECAQQLYSHLKSQLNEEQYHHVQACQYLKELISNEDYHLFNTQEIVQDYKQESILGFIKQSIFGTPQKQSLESQLNEIRQLNLQLIENLRNEIKNDKQQYLLITLVQLEMFFKKQTQEYEKLDYNLFNLDQESLDQDPKQLQNILDQIFTNILT